MHQSSVKNQYQLQRKSVTALLLIFSYVLSIFFSVSHDHNHEYESTHRVGVTWVGHNHSQKQHDESDQRESHSHDCLACQLQLKSSVNVFAASPLNRLTDSVSFVAATSQPFNSTPTKRLTRAPPVA